ncbi:MAG: DUF4278 domain-containing protein [Pseudanabaenaceae cyanobacterium]
MKLHYRGAEYEASDPGIETVETNLVGQYRGAKVRVRVPKQPIAHRHVSGLKYRGVPME